MATTGKETLTMEVIFQLRTCKFAAYPLFSTAQKSPAVILSPFQSPSGERKQSGAP